jgi:hypothetical protein
VLAPPNPFSNEALAARALVTGRGFLAPVDGLLDWLVELPLAQWLAVGRNAASSPQSPAHSASCVVISTTIVDQRLELAAWHVRDAIETVAFIASHSRRPMSRADRRSFSVAHGVAEETALALLTRDFLPSESFRLLCSPFLVAFNFAPPHSFAGEVFVRR